MICAYQVNLQQGNNWIFFLLQGKWCSWNNEANAAPSCKDEWNSGQLGAEAYRHMICTIDSSINLVLR